MTTDTLPRTVGALDVINERNRQVTVEGYDAEHDDKNEDNDLIYAATAYMFSNDRWWPRDWTVPYKPKGRRQNLVRAAALVIAEIDKLDREIDREAQVKKGAVL